MNVYATADLHGHAEILKNILAALKPDDTLYILGDLTDRGPQPWETFKLARKDNRCIILMGNHEDMLINAYEEWKKPGHYFDKNARLLVQNGGHETFEHLAQEEYMEDWVRELKKLPLTAEYTNKNGTKCILTHAGCNYYGEYPERKDLLWNRNHFYNSYTPIEDTVIIHGHTSKFNIAHLFDMEVDQGIQPFWYDKYKCCLDMRTVATKSATILDLDTFDWRSFDERGELNV